MKLKLVLSLAITALISISSLAHAKNFQAGGNGPLKVNKVQLGIKSPITNTCPANGFMKVWVFANKAGTVPIYIAKAGGSSVSGPHYVKVKKTHTGLYMGVYSKTLKIHQPFFAKYRASAPKHGKLSNWVPLKASCKIGLGGNGNLKP